MDWSFPETITSENTVHSLHWFPGNFIPQIPSYLIQLLSKAGDLVFDPFCGSGTTGIEAVLLGRRVLLADINRASLQVTNGKLAALSAHSFAPELQRLVLDLTWEELRSHEVSESGMGMARALQDWFESDTLAQLRYLWSKVISTTTLARQLLELVFADTLFACAAPGTRTSSGQQRRHHWGWIADNVVPPVPLWKNAIRLFRIRLERALEVVRLREINRPLQALVFRGDARSSPIASESVDLIVTSPPYLGMIDYALANRLTYLWMGWDVLQDREGEIGARSRRKRKTSQLEYLGAINLAVAEMKRVLKIGGYCAIVIGASRRTPNAVGEALGILDAAFQRVWGPVSRIPRRRRVSERLGTEATEWIVIYKRRTG